MTATDVTTQHADITHEAFDYEDQVVNLLGISCSLATGSPERLFPTYWGTWIYILLGQNLNFEGSRTIDNSLAPEMVDTYQRMFSCLAPRCDWTYQ